jgi:hypothetical protein
MNTSSSTAMRSIVSAGTKQGHNGEKPPRQDPGGRDITIRDDSRLEHVAALPVFGFGTHLEPHSPAKHSGDEPSHRVGLPAGRFHQVRPGRSAGTLEQGHAPRRLATLAGSRALLGQLGRTSPVVGLLCPSSPLWPLSLGRRNVPRVCANVGLFGRSRRRRSLGSLQIRGCFLNISRSPWGGLQAESLQRSEGAAKW